MGLVVNRVKTDFSLTVKFGEEADEEDDELLAIDVFSLLVVIVTLICY